MEYSFAPITLSVAAQKDMLLIVRLTSAGALTRAGLTLEDTDRFKAAAEEACGCFLSQDVPPERLTLTYTCESGRLTLTADAEEPDGLPGGIDPDEAEVIRCILAALCDQAEITIRDGRVRRVRLTKEAV